MKLINFVVVVIFACSSLEFAEGKEVRWTSHVLTHRDSTDSGNFQARAISQDGEGNLLVAVEEEVSRLLESIIAIFKVDPSGELIWKKHATSVQGIPFDISVDKKTRNVFVIVSESKRKHNFSRAHIVRFSEISRDNDVRTSLTGEEIFFSTPGNVGVTKLFGCVLHPVTGDLYVTGGTSASLYRQKTLGKGDAIVIRLGPSGNVLSAIQFGSGDNEVGRSIAMNADGSALVVVTKRQFPSGMSTSETYQLDPQDLSILDGPHSPFNHGADPLFNPKSIAIVGPVASQANTLVTFVGGDALVRPDTQADIYIHIFTKIANSIKEMTITFDGAKKLKGVDSCVSTQIGSDGNVYCLGYTELNRPSVSRRLNLIVVSPTGELLLERERAIIGNIPLQETPTASTIIESGSFRKLIYVGSAQVSGRNEATIGFIQLPKEHIRTFPGFKNSVVTGAGSVVVPTATGEPNRAFTNPPSIPAIAGAAVGGAGALFLVIAGFVSLERRRRHIAGVSRTTRTTTVTEDYEKEVNESFNDELTPRETQDAAGALV